MRPALADGGSKLRTNFQRIEIDPGDVLILDKPFTPAALTWTVAEALKAV